MSWALSVQFSSRYKGILGRSQLGDGNGSGVLGRHEGGAWVKAGERASENQEQKSEHVGSVEPPSPCACPGRQEQRAVVGGGRVSAPRLGPGSCSAPALGRPRTCLLAEVKYSWGPGVIYTVLLLTLPQLLKHVGAHSGAQGSLTGWVAGGQVRVCVGEGGDGKSVGGWLEWGG